LQRIQAHNTVRAGTEPCTFWHILLYPLPTFLFATAIDSKMARGKTKGSPTKKPPAAKKKAVQSKQVPPKVATKKATPKTPPNQLPVSNVALRKPTPTQQLSPGNSMTTAPMTSVAVPNAPPTNDGSTHGNSTLGGGEYGYGAAGIHCVHKLNDAE
jgi:hypothetical protein